MRNLLAILLAVALTLGANAGISAAPQAGDIVIKNGRVIDGTGAPAVEKDVLVRGDKIVEIAELGEEFPAEVTVIDAAGRAVTPGFIDTHSHGDPAESPEMHNFLAMGVTTLCLGQDGSSTRVSDLPSWFEKVTAAKPGPNVLTFVGHGTVRREAGVNLSPNPTDDELTSMVRLVDRAMELGAFGMTTGLEYQPGTFSKAKELEAVAKPVGARKRVVMSHTRNEDDDQITSSIRELVEQCRATGARAHVSHIKSVYGKGAKRAEEILAVLDEARRSGVKVTADIYPYTASHTGLAILFPDWALPPNDYKQVVETQRERLLEFLREKVAKRNGPEATLFGSGAHAGRTLAQVAAEHKMPYEQVLLELGPRGGSAAYFVMDEELQNRLLVADGVNICTDGSPSMRHPRGYGSFARVLAVMVREKKLLPLEKAIHKMSGLTAETVGLDRQGRGALKPGNFADIVIFDPAKVRDTATFPEPHQLAEGFDFVLVNGKVIRKDGAFTGERHGRLLKMLD